MPETDPPHLLAYRIDLDVLIGRWNYQPALDVLPPTYAALAAEARRTGCRFWLQDIRRRAVNDPQTTRWLLHNFFPQLARELGGRLCVAYLASPALHQHILAEPGYAPSESYTGRPFVLDFFGDEGAAVAWLHQQQQAE